MHELFAQVLSYKDLSRAGELFRVEDVDIEQDLSLMLDRIYDIANSDDYLTNTNNQSVVEICITRITSAIRATGTIEQNAGSLVHLLHSCLKHNLHSVNKDVHPPHAKIASDILSCLFNKHNTKTSVMEQTIPVAVQFLDHANPELCHSMSSYLSCAARDNVILLSNHTERIVVSIVTGNHQLVRVLPHIYSTNREPVNKHVGPLIDQLKLCDETEKSDLLQVVALVAKDKPSLLIKHVDHLCEYLVVKSLALTILAMFIDVVTFNAVVFVEYVTIIEDCVNQQSGAMILVAQILGHVGVTSEKMAHECIQFLTSQLNSSEAQTEMIKQIKHISEAYPSVLVDYITEISRNTNVVPTAAKHLIHQLKDIAALSLLTRQTRRKSNWTNTSTTTILQDDTHASTATTHAPSRSTSTYFNASSSNIHSTNNLTFPNSKNASTSTREISYPAMTSVHALHNAHGSHVGSMHANSRVGLHTNGSTHTGMHTAGSTHTGIHHPGSTHAGTHHGLSQINSQGTSMSYMNSSSNNILSGSAMKVSTSNKQISTKSLADLQHTSMTNMSKITQKNVGRGGPISNSHSNSALSVKSGSKNAINVHKGNRRQAILANTAANVYQAPQQPVSFPQRDTVQQFCEKHLDKIKHYISNVNARIPIPVKSSLEEVKHKTQCRLDFICFGRGPHCLYPESFFTIYTKNARSWIHIMFLAIQARSARALSQKEPAVLNLKDCWQALMFESDSFVRLVTSTFPSTREQDVLLHELNSVRYFDIFEFNAPQKHWGCFLCNYPEKVDGLLPDGSPTMEGQLKEKKGKWKLFKRWKTRYFTLSGASISYSRKDSKKETLPICKIQSVKAIRKGIRDIPKAFEIFTQDQSYVFKAKDGKNAEQWLQCLQIAVARTRTQNLTPADHDVYAWDLKPKTIAVSPTHTNTRL